MSKIIVEKIQGGSGGSELTIPTADGTAGTFIKIDGSGNLSFAGLSVLTEDSPDIVGSVVSNSARNNVYSTGEWSSSGPWTTYYHSWQDANSITQGFNMFMGDGYPNGTTQVNYTNDGSSNAATRIREYAHGQRIGVNRKDYYYIDNITTNYSGVSWRCIPVRNTTGSTITRTFTGYLSARDTNYGGNSFTVYTPNSSVYSTTTGGAWSKLTTPTANTDMNAISVSVVVPANTTVLIMMNSIHRYATTARFKDTSYLTGLQNSFGNGLVCDLRMLETLATAQIGKTCTNQTSHPQYLYPACAAAYGDR